MNGDMNDVAVGPGRTRGMMADTRTPEPGKSKRQSLGASVNSPFPAGSLRNPLVSEAGASGLPSLQSSRLNDSMHEDDISSDGSYSFIEVATTGVNTTPSLYDNDVVDNKMPEFDEQGKKHMEVHEAGKKDADVARDRCSGLWRFISHCLLYTVLAFFVVIVTYYIVMHAGAIPVLVSSLVDGIKQRRDDMREAGCIRSEHS